MSFIKKSSKISKIHFCVQDEVIKVLLEVVVTSFLVVDVCALVSPLLRNARKLVIPHLEKRTNGP